MLSKILAGVVCLSSAVGLYIQYTSANSITQGTNIFVRINECSN